MVESTEIEKQKSISTKSNTNYISTLLVAAEAGDLRY